MEARARAVGRIDVVETPEAAVGPGLVRVSVRRCGVCGSDLHFFLGHQPLPPVCPGHEMSGVVAEVGPGVDGVAVGQRATIEPLGRCRQCDRCLRGDYHLCRELRIYGVTEPGGMATDVVVPAYTLFPLPDDVDFEVGALAEPLAVGIHACRIGGLAPGARVLVLGAGAIGLLAAVAAQHLGAGSVTISARHPHQAEHARRLGCDRVVSPEEVAELRERPAVVVETVGGTATTLGDAIDVVAAGGTVVVAGLFTATPVFRPMRLLAKEIRVVGSMVYNTAAGRADFAIALDVLVARHAALRELVTHVVPLSEAQRAFETAADKRTGSVKVQIDPTA